MRNYKLKYPNQATAMAELIALGVLIEVVDLGLTNYVNGPGVHNVVKLGELVNTPEAIGSDGTVIGPASYLDGYHIDIRTSIEIDFGNAEIIVNNPKHIFQ